MASSSEPEEQKETKRSYWCFISYRHSDNKEAGRQWATWLHQAIETYEVPADLVGKKNDRGEITPERIFPVFRDEEELPADADLGSPIYRALDNSKYLVVICSPRAVQSTYVASEIRYFKRLGKHDRVLAAMIEGEPNASWDLGKQAEGTRPEMECFPEPLRFQIGPEGELLEQRTEPVAADFRLLDGSQGWTTPEAYRQSLRRAGKLDARALTAEVEDYRKRCELMKLKIISGILGVALGSLTKRDAAYQLAIAQKRARVLRRWLGVVGVLSLVAVAFAALAAVQWHTAKRETTEVKQLLAESDVDRSDGLLASGDPSSALWYLCRAISSGAPNPRATERFWFALTQRSWPLPAIDPVPCGGDITAAVFDPTGARFAVATKEGAVSIFTSSDGKAVGAPLAHPKNVRGVLFSPDGTKLLTACDDAIARLWDVSKPSATLLAQNKLENIVTGIAWSTDGSRYVTGSWDQSLCVWDPANPGVPTFQVKMKDKVNTVAFDPTNAGRVLGVAKDEVCVWDVKSPAPVLDYQATEELNGACFSPDGTKVLSYGDEGSVVISELSGGLQQWAQVALPASCSAAAISPDGEVFAVVAGTRVRGYSVQQPPEMLWEQNLSDIVSHLKFTTEGKRLIVACDDGKIVTFDSHSGRSISEPIMDAGTPLAIDFNRTGNRILTARTTQVARIWRLSPPAPLPRGVLAVGAQPVLLNVGQEVQCIAQNGQGLAFAPPTGDWPDLQARKFDFKAPLASAVLMPSGAVVAGATDGRVLALSNGQVSEVGKLNAAVSQLAISFSGNVLAAGADDGGLGLWHWPEATAIPLGWNHTDRVGGLALAEPGTALISASWDRSIARTDWQAGHGGPSRWNVGSEPQVVATDPARHLTLVGLSSGEIWSIGAAPQEAKLAFRVSSSPDSAAFSAGGRLAAIGTVAGTVTIWEVEKSRKLVEIPCGDAPVGAVCFDHEGRWVAVGTDDGTACVYEAATGRTITETMPQSKGVRQILFSPDDQYLVTAAMDGVISIWPLAGPGDEDRAKTIAESIIHDNGTDHRFVPRADLMPTLDEDSLRKTIANLAGGGAATSDEIALLSTYLNQATPAPSH